MFPDNFPSLKPVTIIVGHYGAGKTNLAINMALDGSAAGKHVTLVDMDIVNPYFRSSGYDILEESGVHVITTGYANTNLDIPSINGAAGAAAADATIEAPVIIDVGGDDAGSAALGRFAQEISSNDYDMYYVVNENRNLSAEPNEAAQILLEIESTCHLKATAVVGNNHLMTATDMETVEKGLEYTRNVSKLCGIPVAFVTSPYEATTSPFVHQDMDTLLYPIKTLVLKPWEM